MTTPVRLRQARQGRREGCEKGNVGDLKGEGKEKAGRCGPDRSGWKVTSAYWTIGPDKHGPIRSWKIMMEEAREGENNRQAGSERRKRRTRDKVWGIPTDKIGTKGEDSPRWPPTY